MGRQKPAQPKARPAPADQTFVLQISPERAPQVSRTLELRGSDTLATLHHAIQRSFELDDDHLYAFFLSGLAWDRKTAYEAARAEVTTLAAAGLQGGQHFLYLFD